MKKRATTPKAQKAKKPLRDLTTLETRANQIKAGRKRTGKRI